MLCRYGQKEPINCKGCFNADITTGDKTLNAKVSVIDGNAESLLGQDSTIKLEILTQVNSVSRTSADQSELDTLLKDVFQGLGSHWFWA